MKLNKIMQLFLLGILVFTTSCSDKEYDLIDIVYGEMPEATHTISQLKEVFMGENATPLYNNENTNFNNGKDCSFAVYDIDSENDVIINAVVISSDVEGNIYKKLSLRDLKDGSGIDISIDASGLSAVYPVGQKVSVNLKGLPMGYYGEYPTLGVIYFNRNQNRWEPGRLPYSIAQKLINGF